MQDCLAPFHELIAGWFRERFGDPTEPQRAGWPRIHAGEDVLIAAPKFTIERLVGAADHHVAAGSAEPVWLMPTAPGCTSGETALAAGTVWLADAAVGITIAAGGEMLVARGPARQA